jgi:DNA mismatch repair ATPase MutS
MAEIKSLKRIVDAAGTEGRPVICFIDEILRGTNTSERISAACAVLNYLSELGVITFAATHDIELTTLVSDKYENVHFSENITDDDVTFTYVLEKGPTKSRNAIALLKKNGFPASVTEESEKLCARLDKRSGI